MLILSTVLRTLSIVMILISAVYLRAVWVTFTMEETLPDASDRKIRYTLLAIAFAVLSCAIRLQM